MSQSLRFLNALSHACATMNLYDDNHPARGEAAEEVWDELRNLIRDNPNPVFCFLPNEVIYGDQPIHELKTWTLGKRLAECRIQRVEFGAGISRQELERFLDEVHKRLRLDGHRDETDETWTAANVRFGPIVLPDELTSDMEEAIDAVNELHEAASKYGRVSDSLARGVVHTLSQAMRYGQRLLVPLVPLKRSDQYTTVHSINSSVLSMGLAEYLHLGGGDVRRIGEAALLHDVGKVFTPPDILAKPGKLDDDEWDYVKRHPVDGARLLLKSGRRFELAATVAYEHHVRWDGEGGYPAFRYRRRPHPASRLIQVCDVYDACRTQRPFRAPMPADDIVRLLTGSAGQQFDPHFTKAFTRMMREWESRVVPVGAA